MITDEPYYAHLTITGEVHGLTEQSLSALREFVALPGASLEGHVFRSKTEDVAIVHYAAVCRKDTKTAILSALWKAGLSASSHAMITHGWDHNDPITARFAQGCSRQGCSRQGGESQQSVARTLAGWTKKNLFGHTR